MQSIPHRTGCRVQYRYLLTAIIALVAVSGFFIIPAGATPPSDVILSYNELSSELSVTITHPVVDPTTHYIREVVITDNGKTITDASYTSQPTKDTFTRTYPIQAKPGDDIEVTAACNLAGSRSSHLYVTTTAGPAVTASGSAMPVNQPTTQKAAAGLAPVLGAAAILLVRKNKK
nr:hypothetical protein [uncultured Methanoregula sp.]